MTNNKSTTSFLGLNRDAKCIEPHVTFQSFLVKRGHWEGKYTYPHWQLVFGDKDNTYLSRLDVSNFFSSDTSVGLVSSLIWGFPKGNKPGGANFEPFFNELNFFTQQIEKIQKTALSNQTFKDLNSVPGIKTSVTTKLMYFSDCKIDDVRCLIFDRRVLDTLQLFKFTEFKSLEEEFVKLRANPQKISFNAYKAYCTICSQIAIQLGVTAETIEYLLFNQNIQIALAKASEMKLVS